MNSSGQRQSVLIASIGLTALLVGVFASGLTAWWISQDRMQKRMEDAEFLQGQLDRLQRADGDGAKGPPPAPVRWSVAERKVIRPQRPIVGRLVEVRKVTVASEVTGKIIELAVEEGTPVVGGETVLARVDDVWSQLAIRLNEAQKAALEAPLEYESSELRRYQLLTDRNVTADSELESREASVGELEAKLAQTEVTLEEERERIARSTIVAPFDGTVVAKHVDRGGHVSPGDPIVEVVSRGPIDARLMVPESAINLIRLEQVLPIRIDALGDEVEGVVASITPYGPTASRTFPVRVRLDDRGGRLKVGMSVTASIAVAPEHEALVVSKDAVLVRPDGSTVWVALPRDGTETAEAQPVPVTIAARMPQEYAIEPETRRGHELLGPGARVIVEGAERLRPGAVVRRRAPPDAAPPAEGLSRAQES